MTLRIVDTPLPTPVPELAPRADGWRSELEPALLPGPGASAALARLREAGALVVTTGQQPGLFVGPAYVIHKALSARALARQLADRWRRPVVPIYWVPGDDHDLAEVAGASWIAGDGALVSAELAPRAADAPLTPLWREPLGEQITGLVNTLEQSLPASDDRERIVAWLRRHYRPGATVAGAFGLALAELLAPLGVLCLDSTHAAVKAAARPLLLRALEEAAPLEADLTARAEELAGMGIETGVTVGDDRRGRGLGEEVADQLVEHVRTFPVDRVSGPGDPLEPCVGIALRGSFDHCRCDDLVVVADDVEDRDGEASCLFGRWLAK
jgi:uncharacterized protein YllA (UPF0747 family)